jgi:hypothetical protein
MKCKTKMIQLEEIKIQASTFKKGGPTRGDQDRHHLARVDYAQGKGMILIGFLFTGLVVFSLETGFRIDSRTIKRGSRVSNLFVSFGESSNLCIVGIIFLGSCLFLIHERF